MAAYVTDLHERLAGVSWFVRVIVLAALVAPSAADAAPAAQPIIVLKSRIGVPESKDRDVLTPIIDEQFEAEGFAATPETIARILGGRMPRSGILDRGLTAADIMHPIELGYDDWSKGLFADAVKKLLPAKARIFHNPGLLVTDTKNLDSTFKGLVALSLSQLRTGKPNEAAETMAELVRIFRVRPVSRTDWGRPAEEYWRSISKPVLAGGTGQLYVTTGNDHAVVFVDGQIRGIGKAEVADLVPGSHHVLVQVPSTAGLQYGVEIRANDNTNLDVRLDVDSALAATDAWIGLVFATEAERNKEAVLAGELAQRWGSQRMIVVVGTVRMQGTLVLVGTLYRAGGKLIRSAGTTLDSDMPAQVRRLARYLADGTVGSGLKVMSQDPRQPAPSLTMKAEHEHARSTVIGKTVGGVGLVALSFGAVEYLRHAYDFRKPPNGEDDGRAPYVGTMVGGSLLLGGGVYMWFRDSQSTTHLPAGLVGLGAASILAGSVLYLTDQDLGPTAPPFIRDTATVGVVLGASGAALTSAGLWLMYRDRHGAADSRGVAARSRASWVPAVAVEASRTVVGLCGSF
jgi:hypothetical protein